VPKVWTMTDYHHTADCPLLAKEKPEGVRDPEFDCGCPRETRDMTPDEIAWFEEHVMPALRQTHDKQ
jgi:hypothetical protein